MEQFPHFQTYRPVFEKAWDQSRHWQEDDLQGLDPSQIREGQLWFVSPILSLKQIVTSCFRQLPLSSDFPCLHRDESHRGDSSNRQRLFHGSRAGTESETQPSPGSALGRAVPTQGHHSLAGACTMKRAG